MRFSTIIENGVPKTINIKTPEERDTARFSIALDEKNAQIQALTERNEFLEDLIAELAVQAYSKTSNA